MAAHLLHLWFMCKSGNPQQVQIDFPVATFLEVAAFVSIPSITPFIPEVIRWTFHLPRECSQLMMSSNVWQPSTLKYLKWTRWQMREEARTWEKTVRCQNPEEVVCLQDDDCQTEWTQARLQWLLWTDYWFLLYGVDTTFPYGYSWCDVQVDPYGSGKFLL